MYKSRGIGYTVTHPQHICGETTFPQTFRFCPAISEEELDVTDAQDGGGGAGAFEPVHSPLDAKLCPWIPRGGADWVMRSDARDDRMLVFSKKFHLEAGGEVKFHYPLRVVSPGEFALPGVAVEAMYQPSVRARTAPARCRASPR